MEKVSYAVSIAAPAHTVFQTMLDPEAYREWTAVIHEGSYFIGSWALGSVIRFMGPDPEGRGEGGMFGTIVAHRPDEFISIEYSGLVGEDGEDTTSDLAKQTVGMVESYTFDEVDGVTTLTVELDTAKEFADFFDEVWPGALEKLKEIAER